MDDRHSGGGRTLAAAVAAALIGGLLATAGAASANWEPAKRVDNAGSGYGATNFANALSVGPNGLATALFFQQAPDTPSGANGSPFAIRRAAGAAAWSGPAEVATPSGQVDSFAGTELAAGADGGTLGVFAFDPAGGGAHQTLATSWPAGDPAPGAAAPVLCTSGSPAECAPLTPQVAIDGSGNGYAVAAANDLSGDILFSRTDPSTGTWGPAQVVAQGTDPKLAVDSGGDVVVTYVRPDSGAPNPLSTPFDRLYAKRELAGEASFGAEHLISGPSNLTDKVTKHQTALVIDSAGNATAVFPQGTEPSVGAGEFPATFAVRWPRDGDPQAPHRISPSPQDEGNAGHAVAAVDPQGRVTAAWDASTLNFAVYAAQYAPGSGWGAAQRISPQNSPDSYQAPRLAADADGTVTLAYFDQPNPAAGLALDAERKPAGQPWSAPAVISATGAGAGGVQYGSAEVAAAKAGQADATFVQQLNGTNRLFATRFTDTTAPTITITIPKDGATYAQGATVVADYSCKDEPGGSGLASCSGPVSSGQPIDTATAGAHSFTVTARDKAGNSASKTVAYTVKAGPPPPETTPPTITITRPHDGATYRQGATVRARYSCHDEPGGSGLASCRGTVPSGRPINTRTPGTKTFAVTASDRAGNTASKTVTYTVKPRARRGRPNTRIVAAKISSHKHLAKFRFRGKGGIRPYRFECKLHRPKGSHHVKKRFHRCSSPKLYKHLKAGHYTFKVRAIDKTGAVDPTPAKHRWTIKR